MPNFIPFTKTVKRNFQVNHQELWILDIDFKKKRLAGYTQLFITSNVNRLNKIKLNCQQCIIRDVKILKNECNFYYLNPLANISKDTNVIKKIKHFSNAYYESIKLVDADLQNGELIIYVPDDLVFERKFAISIEYFIEQPDGGIYFESEKNLYTYENVPRLWFPCVDSLSEAPTWYISIECDKKLTAISNGTLIQEKVMNGKKVFGYFLNRTCAANIGLTVGFFEKVINPKMPEVIYYCHPSLINLLENICDYTEKILDYYEGFLNFRYPFSNYRQVFVNVLPKNYVSYSSLSILNVNLLHSKSIIDQVYITRKVLAKAIAEQFFGCFILPDSCPDAWIVRGIAGFLAYNYVKEVFGTNEYLYQVRELSKRLMNYEDKFRPVVLNTMHESYVEKHYFNIDDFSTFSPLYDKMHRIKSFLVMRMLEFYLTRQYLHEIFCQILLNFKTKLVISTKEFIRLVHNISEKNVREFFNQWVFQGGHIRLECDVVFCKKYLLLNFSQTPNGKNICLYQGPINIYLQEIAGLFKHTQVINGQEAEFKIFYQSKQKHAANDNMAFFSNKELKFKVKNANKPILWITFDPELELLREIEIDFKNNLSSWCNEMATISHWECKLKYESSIIGQLECLEDIFQYRDTKTIFNTVLSIITNERVFYRVRCKAAMCLTELYNRGLYQDNSRTIVAVFKEMLSVSVKFNFNEGNHIFNNFQNYFLRKDLFLAFSQLQSHHAIAPYKVTYEILNNLVRFNHDNKRFSDDYYMATLIEALANTVTPSVLGTVNEDEIDICQDYQFIIKEIHRKFLLDRYKISYKYIITSACLKALHRLGMMNFIQFQSKLYRAYASGNHFIDIRKTAINILVDITKQTQSKEELNFLLDLIVDDPCPAIKYHILKELIRNPPFKPDLPEGLDDEELLVRLSNMLKKKFFHLPKLRCALVDLFFTLYGNKLPKCVPCSELSFIFKLDKKLMEYGKGTKKYYTSENIVAEVKSADHSYADKSPETTVVEEVEAEEESETENTPSKKRKMEMNDVTTPEKRRKLITMKISMKNFRKVD